ncbi:MAG TPA: hypothetical protein VFQ05_13710, partial [Candidatus Eisenbacteria bacterium]|nr:hypothetical protein [Candidatus Eisenbacteria bacterium]
MPRLVLAALRRPPQVLLAFLALPLLVSTANATDLCGAITSNTTLTLSGSPYTVTCPVTVYNGAQLTIEPGVTLEFEAGAGLTVGHPNGSSTGSLMAVGTAESPIVFTSTSGVPGGWNGIIFWGSSLASQMSYCVIENG